LKSVANKNNIMDEKRTVENEGNLLREIYAKSKWVIYRKGKR